jgi:hypothetical protein
MGHFHVEADLTGPTGVTERIVPIQVAGGTKERWPLADVRLSLGDEEVVTPCLIVPEGAALLGAVALETLLLAVDPVAKRLVPTDGYALRSAAVLT